MEKHLDIQKCLTAFARIIEKGNKNPTENVFELEGIKAASLDDGYTIRLFDHRSELTIYFHNKHAIQSPDSQTMDLFLKSIYAVADGRI
ncbi:DUF3081 domain-containing protein [Endozoicomonas sp. Mp262]|uniref:DUF3081 domain-containing protein n=1 Tax=Endozoicomonas sp. Mp262 TaxID=2919499 RepID=UPI0021DA44F5